MKKKTLLTALSVLSVVSAAIGLAACNTDEPTPHTHNWSAWTVTEPTKVTAGTATRSCDYTDCNETEEVELPPLASKSEYTVTDDTATCTESGTATYTYKQNTSISFTAATDAKGHDFGKAVIVDGVPVATCGECGQKVAAELSGTITPSADKATFYAGGEIEYTLTAYPSAQGYYTFTYEGEKEIRVEYSYYSLKDGEVSDTVTLSGSGRTKITVYLETRATCVMKITSAEATAFAGDLSLEFSTTDPSYVIPELSLDVTTVKATYEGVIYQFTAPVSGSYTLSCDSNDAVIILDGTAELLNLPYTFTLEKNGTVSFAMCCDGEAAEYDVQVGLNMRGSGTYADPYVITEEMLAVNVNTILKNGETKYYKIEMQGDYLLNCLPVKAQGSYPDFVNDKYTAETYTADIVIAEQTIKVTGWQVSKINCGKDGFVFALTCSGSEATDNVMLYVNHVYGSESNPASWVWYYFYYNTGVGFEIGETIHIDFLARVSGRIDISTLNISSVKMNGKTLATGGDTFEMTVTEGETYSFECVICSDTTETYYIYTDVQTEITTVTRPTGTQIGTKFDGGSILLWLNYSEGTENNPYKLNESVTGFETYANDCTYAKVSQSGKYTFAFTNLTATLNGETALVSGTQYKLVQGDVIGFVNEGNAAAVSVAFEANTGDITNPLLVSELQSDAFTVESGATYYVKADGESDIVLTFSGVTVTCNDSPVISGTKFNIKDGDIITIINESLSEVTVNYTTTAVLGSVNNPKTLTVGTAQTVDQETYFNLTLTGENKFTVSVSDVTPLTVNGLNKMNMAVLPDVTYPLYSTVIEIDNKKYVFNAEGVLCSYVGNNSGINVGYNGDKKAAFVATDDSEVLELKAGTYLLHVVKNQGTLSVLETMSVDCTLTVTEIEIPTVTVKGSGTSEDPFVIEESGVYNGETVQGDGTIFGGMVGVKYYVYNATENGTLTIVTDKISFVLASKTSFADAENALSGGGAGDSTQGTTLTVEVAAGETVYLLAGYDLGYYGEYSFNAEFVSSQDGSSEKPYTAKAVNAGETVQGDGTIFGGMVGVKHYVYNAAENGTLTIITDKISFVLASKTSFADAENALSGGGAGDSTQGTTLTVEVAAGETVYLLAGYDLGYYGEYSFNTQFTAD